MQKNKQKKMRRLKGFTLMELMVVVTVIMVLVAASGSGIFSTGLNTGRKGAAEELASLIDFARVGAMSSDVAFMVGIKGIGNGLEAGIKRVEVYKLSSNTCAIPSNWDKPVKMLDLKKDYAGIGISKVIYGGVSVTNNTFWFCVEPDGTVRDAYGNFPANVNGVVVDVELRTFDTHGNFIGTPIRTSIPYMGVPKVTA